MLYIFSQPIIFVNTAAGMSLIFIVATFDTVKKWPFSEKKKMKCLSFSWKR